MSRHSRSRSRLFDVESLRVFRELVAQGGFTAVAKTLGISQPTVSLTIRRLEERLGMSLIVRNGYSAIPFGSRVFGQRRPRVPGV